MRARRTARAPENRPIPSPTAVTRLIQIGLKLVLATAISAAGLVPIAASDRAGAATTLVGWGSTWRYRDNGVAPSAGWETAAYNDTFWKSGLAEFGYGDGDERTVVSYGPSATNKYVTTWFRRSFSVASPAAFSTVTIGVRRDDGIRVFLNGKEVLRNNLPTGTISATTWANSPNISETEVVSVTLPATSLGAGSNVLAVEVHQASVSSSDLSFDLQMQGDTAAATSYSMVAVGDIAECNRWRPTQVANVVAKTPGTYMPLGDLVYPTGTITGYRNCYDPYFGQFNSRVKPMIGNHEYKDPGANGYFTYFGSKAGAPGRTWHSFERGNWHIVVLDSECDMVGGCGPGSPQYQWLTQDLANSTTACLAVAWHRPRWSSSATARSDSVTDPLYRLALAEGADLLLSGHAHSYERFSRLNASGAYSATGIRQFVVGTGGAALYEFGAPVPGSSVRNNTTYGALNLTLGPSSYSWKFIPIEGQTFTDSGTDRC